MEEGLVQLEKKIDTKKIDDPYKEIHDFFIWLKVIVFCSFFCLVVFILVCF